MDAPRVGFRRWGLRGDELWSWIGVGRHRWSAVTSSRSAPGGRLSRTGGLFAYWAFESLELEEISPPQVWMGAAGTVVAWGHIVEHELGMRAQYMRPVALLDTPQAAGPSARYALPVLSRDELVAYAGWFGERKEVVAWGR